METQLIQNKIYEIRGRRVMLDFDLAALYGIETKVLKQSVRRNIERFEGEDFMFELSFEELNLLKISSRSQFVTLNSGRGSNIKYTSFAFTEMGVAMLSSVLNSPTAIEINRGIMRAFVMMRQLMMTSVEIRQLALENAEIRAKLELLEKNDELLARDNEDTLEAVNDLSEDTRKHIDNLYAAIGELSVRPVKVEKPRMRIGYRTPSFRED
jgi:arsenate reductase-like glutaredoxin family protein